MDSLSNFQPKYACKACGTQFAMNATRMAEHLRQCINYLISENKDNDKILHSTINPIIFKQTTLSFPMLTENEKHRLDLKCAALCYEDDLPFSFVKSETFKTLLRDEKLNPAYKPPSRKAVAINLLDKTYTEWKSKINNILAETSFLNIITDGSTNINNTRIQNISIHSDNGSFYHHSKDVGALSMTAINQANWIKKQLRDVCNEDFKRINSLATDTCLTMLATWEELEVYITKFYVNVFRNFQNCGIVSLLLATVMIFNFS